MSSPHDAAVRALKHLLGERCSTGDSVRELRGRDEAWHRPEPPAAVLFPESTEEVQAVVRVCAEHACPVVPYGVGTSLEGQIIPVRGGITIDTSRMNAIITVNDQDLDVVVQPGVTRKQLNTDLRATGLMFTVDPGADATIGGMASTRASGTNTVRYGTMRENVLAMQVVLADGRAIRVGTRARKSSAGYDLKNLFVGSEGTLGIITELTLRLFGQPEAVSAATCAFEDIDQAVNAVIVAIQCGLPLARVELLDTLQMRGMNLRNPDMNLPEKPHLFLEFHGTEATVSEQTARFRDIADDHGGHAFNWATHEEDRNRLWRARHDAYYAGKALRPGCEGYVTDCCVPISALAETISRSRALIEKSGLIAPLVGHVGDGNFHLLLLLDPDAPAELQRAKALAHDINHLALELDGTVTGEHGVGLGKKAYMQDEHGDAWQVMTDIKRTLDPQNLMNPGKLVDLN